MSRFFTRIVTPDFYNVKRFCKCLIYIESYFLGMKNA